MWKLVGLAALATTCACGSGNPVVVTQVNAATNAEKGTAGMVKGLATKTPPANGTSMGMMSQPKAGNTTIPINNVEVYVFTANIDSSPGDETLYWADDGDTVYVWGQIALECVDDNGDPTGETGTADFIYEDNGDTYGWLTSTDSCGYSTLYGCSDDGSGEVCGGCDWNAAFIACTTLS
jgi:hypothetical protein